MAGIVKPAVRAAWASSAAASSITDPDTVTAGYSGVGFPLSTQPPARQFWNWVLNYCMNGIRYFSRRGIADWDPLETYLANDIVRGDNNIVYQSLQASNTNNPPSTSPAFWGGLTGYALTGQLTGYVTTAQMNTALTAYETTAALAATLSNYETVAALNTTLASYETTAAHNASLANYSTTAQINSQLTSYATIVAMNNALASYATNANLSANYYTNAQIASLLSSYYTAAQVNSVVANYTPLTTFNAEVAALAYSFSQVAANGSYTHPGGFIVKFGTSGFSSNPGTTVNFTTPFPTICAAVVPCRVFAGGGYDAPAYGIEGQTRFGFRGICNSGNGALVSNWVAVGW